MTLKTKIEKYERKVKIKLGFWFKLEIVERARNHK